MTTPPPAAPGPEDHDSVASATRALADATASLTRLLGNQLGAISGDVGNAVAEGLREASRGLAEASESVSRAGAGAAARSRRERVDQTRRELLDAMARIVASRGYEGASVGEIAAEAGYTKGAVYANFGSKEELFVALVRREADHGRLLPAGPLDPAGAATDERGALLAAEVLAYAARHPGARNELRTVLDAELDRLAALARDARVGGAEAGGATAEVTQQDRDTALAVVGTAVAGRLLATVSRPPRAEAEAPGRVLRRLLGR